MNADARVERLLRELSPRVLGALVRRFGDFADCEDATQEALLEAAVAWSSRGIPDAGLDLLAGLDDDSRMAAHHRLDAVRAHLLELSGQPTAARAHYQRAARRTVSLAERRYLDDRAACLAP